MLKFMSALTICLFALLASSVLVTAKPHLLTTTGISYATPAIATATGPIAAVATPIGATIARPVFAQTGYYPAYASPFYGYGSYATYPYFGSTYFVRR